MNIPNPYTGDYKRLVIIPIILAILSLTMVFLISPIRLGIDFKGGIDVEILSESQIDLEPLVDKLNENGFRVDGASTDPVPSGYNTKFELERSNISVIADDHKRDFFNIAEKAEKTEIDAVIYNNTDAKAELGSIRDELNTVSNKIFGLAGSDKRAENYDTIQLLKKDVLNSYAKISSEQNDLLREILSSGSTDGSISLKERTASLSEGFIDKAVMVVIYSVLLTSIVVFLIFRTAIPSFAVLAGAAADIIFALGAMAFFDIPLTLASFVALLMLVGFSLDTDILLTIRLVKRKDGTPAQRAFESMKTGMTMSMSTMVAFIALFIIAMVTKINIYYEISAVAIAGLVGDLIATWCFNAVVVLYHMEDLLKKGISLDTKPILSYIFKN